VTRDPNRDFSPALLPDGHTNLFTEVGGAAKWEEALVDGPTLQTPRKSFKPKPQLPVNWSTFPPPQWSSFTPP
jgi:hypothetical protein